MFCLDFEHATFYPFLQQKLQKNASLQYCAPSWQTKNRYKTTFHISHFFSSVECILVRIHVYKYNNTMQIKFMFIIENPDNALLNIQVAKSINNICCLMDCMANFQLQVISLVLVEMKRPTSALPAQKNFFQVQHHLLHHFYVPFNKIRFISYKWIFQIQIEFYSHSAREK